MPNVVHVVMDPRVRADHHRLLLAVARGDVDAFAAIYDHYAPLMFGVARRMLADTAAAEDLVHDVFIEAWRHAGSYAQERGSVRAWLLIRLRSRALDRLRAERVRRRKQEPGLAMGQARAEDPQRVCDRRRAIEALAGLDTLQRETIVLAYFEGLSAREIAERLQAPIGTVKSRIAAGLLRLRESFGASAEAQGNAAGCARDLPREFGACASQQQRLGPKWSALEPGRPAGRASARTDAPLRTRAPHGSRSI